MQNTKSNLRQFGKRKPYEPVNELFQIPVALYEVLALVEKAEAEGSQTAPKMKELLSSIIEVALNDPEAWLKIENLPENGYQFAYLPPEKLNSSDVA